MILRKLSLPTLCVLSAMVVSCGSDDKTEAPAQVHNVFLTTPESLSASASGEYSATIEESRTIGVSFKTGGQIENVYVKEGDFVHAGQLIATLDSRDYRLAVEQLTIQYKQLQSEMARKDQLFQTGNLSPNDYEKAKSGFEQTRVQLEMNRNKLSYTRLTAPASGYITKRNHESGETVNAGTAIVELMDDSNLEVVVDIPSSEYARRDNFRAYHARQAGSNASFDLKYMSLTPKADNNMLYQLRLSVPAESRKGLTAGMNLTVKIDIDGADTAQTDVTAGTYAVPMRSVFKADGKEYVWIFNANDSTVKRHEVHTSGNVNDGLVSVSGLNGSEQIVRAGVNVLQEGEKVSVIEKASSTNKGELL